jgi:plastocyanin
MMNRSVGMIALAAACALGLAACSGDDDDDSPTVESTASDGTDPGPTEPNGSSNDNALTIEGFAFVFPAEVGAGSVDVVNNDAAQHTITDDGGSFDHSIDANASTSIDLAAGTYEVHCNIHPTMTGTLTVV